MSDKIKRKTSYSSESSKSRSRSKFSSKSKSKARTNSSSPTRSLRNANRRNSTTKSPSRSRKRLVSSASSRRSSVSVKRRRRNPRSRSRSRSYNKRYPPRNRPFRSRSRSRDFIPKRRKRVEDAPPSKCIAVFGLSKKTEEKYLQKVFSEYGKIDYLNLVYNRATNQSKGFGFVHFADIDSAILARQEASGMNIDGNNIRIDFCIQEKSRSPPPPPIDDRYKSSNRRRPRSRSSSPQPRSRRRRSDSRSPKSRRRNEPKQDAPPSRCLCVFGLCYGTDEKDLEDVFREYGKIDKVQLVYDKANNASKGYGFVYYTDIDSAIKAKKKADGMVIDGRKVTVVFSLTKKAHSPTPGVYMGRR